MKRHGTGEYIEENDKSMSPSTKYYFKTFLANNTKYLMRHSRGPNRVETRLKTANTVALTKKIIGKRPLPVYLFRKQGGK